jgi:hypothetical protein
VFGETNCNSRQAMMLSSKSIVSIQNYFKTTSKAPGITAASFHTTTPKSKSSAALDHHSQINKPQKQRKFHSLNCDTPYQLCFLRHGQSTWNRDNRFIGWTDTPLTDDGVLEARVAGQMLARSGMKFDEVHTSLLRRCIRTTNLVLMEMKQEYIPVHKHWRLNERHYGNLVGKNKKEVVKLHGQEQVEDGGGVGMIHLHQWKMIINFILLLIHVIVMYCIKYQNVKV